MLINLSNYPSENWVTEQLDEAHQKYGRVLDIPFPIISPISSLEQINIIVMEYFERITSILDITESKSNAVHIIGDLTFSFHLLLLLKEADIKAICSTSIIANDELNSSDSLKLKFVRFREYY